MLDAVVIAAIQGIPRSILDREDLPPRPPSLCDAVGPLLAGQAVSVWSWVVAELELLPATPPAPKERVVTLVDKLRPPPPVPV